MKSALVVGLGNPLRGDDGAAHHVIDSIEKKRPDVRCLALHQLTPDLAEDLAASERVIFIDASVRVKTVTARAITSEHSLFTSHHMTPEAVLSTAEELYGARTKAWLVEVPAFDLAHGDTLSAATESAVHEAITQVEALLEQGI